MTFSNLPHRCQISSSPIDSCFLSTEKMEGIQKECPPFSRMHTSLPAFVWILSFFPFITMGEWSHLLLKANPIAMFWIAILTLQRPYTVNYRWPPSYATLLFHHSLLISIKHAHISSLIHTHTCTALIPETSSGLTVTILCLFFSFKHF